jgi:glucose-6-phosphate dehydrogenase assembly protein OpcA
MATTYKVLGQSAPLATTATTLYTVPSSTATIVSSITVCNRGTAAATYRIAIRPNGDSLANVHYVAFDSPINPKDTIALTLGITADAADVITVYASTADFTFNAFGSEIS